MSLCLELFFVFVRIGFTSFGGMSMIPVINREMLDHQWMTLREVADIVAIAEMTPGPLGINCATFVGMRVAGLPGALCANLGVLFPTISITALAAIFFQRVKGNMYWERGMYGIRPICLALIFSAVLTLSADNFWSDAGALWLPVLIAGIVGALIWKTRLGIPVLIVIAGVLGVLLA